MKPIEPYRPWRLPDGALEPYFSFRPGQRFLPYLHSFLVLICFLSCPVFSPAAAATRDQTAPAKPQPQDENCLACHGQPDMTGPNGKSVSVNPAKHAASVHGVLSCTDCHSTIKDYPHPAKVARVKCATCHEDQTVLLPKSVHGVLGEQACESCHGNHHEISAASAALTKCATCHGDEVKALNVSIHGQAAAQGDPDAPKCASCHGAVHQIQGSSEPASMVAKKNLPETCASCHSNQQFLSRHSIPFAHPVELYKQSVHGRKLAQGDGAVATCSDCHGSHEILPAQDARSKINHWNLPATCGQCHAEIAKTYGESVHGQAIKAGVAAAPVCSDCHGEHLILEPQQAGSLVNASRVSTVTCGRCHSDERLALRYNLPTDRVPSYADSYHGLAMRGGSQIVANCASCHGVHNIFRSSDARSTVNSANLARTCGACHAGAGGTHFSIGPVHVLTASGPNHPVVKWIRWTYWVLIPMTLGFMLLHNLLDLVSKLVRGRPRHVSGARVTRMARNFRIAHAGVIMSFPVLVFTGFALKFPEAWWARPILLWERHFAFRGAVHRSAAVIITVATLYHFLHLALVRKDRLFLKAMMPGWRDATDLLHVFAYNLGLTKSEPTFAKFNYAEKMEYWAFLWGTVVMTVSGLLLWFNNFTLRYFPKWISDAATAIHYYEALLATFSILIWHFYMVIFDPLVYPMDTAWLDGKVPADHYRHSRPEYYRALQRAGLIEVPAEQVRSEKQEEEFEASEETVVKR